MSYIIHKVNAGWFKKGQTSWKKGTGEPLEGDKECPICHKQFHYKRAAYNDPPKTCSKECRYKSASITGTHHVTRVCVVCGKAFSFAPSLLKDRATIFCSMKCRRSGAIRYDENTKKWARLLVYAKVQQGTLEKLSCEVCNNPKTHAHHYKGYKPENWLDVKWLCHKHHAAEHARLRKTGESILL